MKAGTIDVSSFKQSLQKLVTQADGQIKNEDAQRISYYFEGDFFDDMAECSYEYYSKHITVKDYEYLMAKYTSEEGKLASKHSVDVVGKFVENLQVYFAQDFVSKLPRIMKGEVVEPRKATCSDNYKAKWDMYCKSTGVDSIIDAMIGQIKGMFANMEVSEGKKAELDKALNGVINYLLKDVMAYMCDVSEGVLTEADLDYYIEVMSSEAGQHMKEASIDLVSDAVQVGLQLQELQQKHLK